MVPLPVSVIPEGLPQTRRSYLDIGSWFYQPVSPDTKCLKESEGIGAAGWKRFLAALDDRWKNRHLSMKQLDVFRAAAGLVELVGRMPRCEEKLLRLLGNKCRWSIAGCDDVALGSFTQHNARLTVYPIFLPRSS